jgi:epsilon-lactone hydrolase
MPSLQLYLMKPVMRVMRWQQGRMDVSNIDRLVWFRQSSERWANRILRPPREVIVENATIAGVAGEWFIPPNPSEETVLMFLHGGGIVFGWGSAHRKMLGYLALMTGLRAFGVDYRLVPEHPYPAAHDDCFAVYQALIRQGRQVVLVGESSGGVLALATMLRAKSSGRPQPALCVLISPAVDYGFKNATPILQSRDTFTHPKFVVDLHRHYIGTNNATLPDFNPVDADLSGLAPLTVLAGKSEILAGETQRLAEAAKRHYLPAELILFPDVWHGWHLLAPTLPEAVQALKAVAQAIKQRLSEVQAQ